jgi:hypothetical protein
LQDLGAGVDLAEVFLQVHAGSPRIAGAGQHQHAGVDVEFQRFEHLDHLGVERWAHRVTLLGAVERDPGDALVHLHVHGLPAPLVVSHFHLLDLSAC